MSQLIGNNSDGRNDNCNKRQGQPARRWTQDIEGTLGMGEHEAGEITRNRILSGL